MISLQLSSSNPPASTSPPSHQPTNAYTAGLPAPPRILIPPPSMSLDSSRSHHNSSIHGPQPPPLESMVLTSSSAVLPGSLQDWKYESRREAQLILPHLYLGPLSAAKDAAFLAQAGITQLLAVRSSMTARAKLGNKPLPGLSYTTIDVSSNADLITQFARASETIDAHYLSSLPPTAHAQLGCPMDGRALREFQESWMAANNNMLPPGGKTLVYCESGNERSAAVAAAYIMQHLGGTAVQAIQMIQGKRFCVCFDDSMKWMLTSYEPIWTARRQNGSGGMGVGVGVGVGKQKRRYEEDEDEAGHGKGVAPFLDDDGRGDVEMQ